MFSLAGMKKKCPFPESNGKELTLTCVLGSHLTAIVMILMVVSGLATVFWHAPSLWQHCGRMPNESWQFFCYFLDGMGTEKNNFLLIWLGNLNGPGRSFVWSLESWTPRYPPSLFARPMQLPIRFVKVEESENKVPDGNSLGCWASPILLDHMKVHAFLGTKQCIGPFKKIASTFLFVWTLMS